MYPKRVEVQVLSTAPGLCVDSLQILRAAMLDETQVKIGAELRERHLAKPRQQQGLRILECLVESRIDCLLDKTARRLRPIRNGEYRRGPQSGIDVEQGHL